MKGVFSMNNTGWQEGMAPGYGAAGMKNGGADMTAAASPANARALGAELVTLLREGVESGDVDRGYPEEIGRLVDAGAGISELAEALKQATQRGRISPLMLTRAEKLLGVGPGPDELADRSQVISRYRNKLAL
jgi:hypothetical protein